MANIWADLACVVRVKLRGRGVIGLYGVNLTGVMGAPQRDRPYRCGVWIQGSSRGQFSLLFPLFNIKSWTIAHREIQAHPQSVLSFLKDLISILFLREIPLSCCIFRSEQVLELDHNG